MILQNGTNGQDCKVNSKRGFNDIEFGTSKTENEINSINFLKEHADPPKAIFLSYSENGISLPGEPKELKAFSIYNLGFRVTVSSYDNQKRTFSWIALW